MKRLIGAALVAMTMAMPLIVAPRFAADCRPLACQNWDVFDWQWWYFRCDLPPCEAGGQT